MSPTVNVNNYRKLRANEMIFAGDVFRIKGTSSLFDDAFNLGMLQGHNELQYYRKRGFMPSPFDALYACICGIVWIGALKSSKWSQWEEVVTANEMLKMSERGSAYFLSEMMNVIESLIYLGTDEKYEKWEDCRQIMEVRKIMARVKGGEIKCQIESTSASDVDG